MLTKFFGCCIIILVSWANNPNIAKLVSWANNPNIAKMHFLPKKPKAKLKPLKINYLFTLLAQLAKAFDAAPRPKGSAYEAKGGIKSKGPGFPETKKT